MKSKILSFLLILGLSAPAHATSSSAVSNTLTVISNALSTALDTTKTVLNSQKTLAAIHFLPPVMTLIQILPLYFPNFPSLPNLMPSSNNSSNEKAEMIPTDTEAGQFIHRTVEELANGMGIQKPILIFYEGVDFTGAAKARNYPEDIVCINPDLFYYFASDALEKESNNKLKALAEAKRTLDEAKKNKDLADASNDAKQKTRAAVNYIFAERDYELLNARLSNKREAASNPAKHLAKDKELIKKIFKGVVAHELAHIKNNDNLYGPLIIYGVIPLLSWLVAKKGPIWLLGSKTILEQLLAWPYYHHREYRADFDGTCACNDPYALISFFKKAPDPFLSFFTTLIGDVAEINPTLVTMAHIFLDHPSNGDRINALQKLITPEHRASEIYNDTKAACIEQFRTVQTNRCDTQAATAAESSKSEVPHVMTAAVTTHESSTNPNTKSNDIITADTHNITANDASPAAQPAME